MTQEQTKEVADKSWGQEPPMVGVPMFARFDGERFIPLKMDPETGRLTDNPEYEVIPVPVENNCLTPFKGELQMVLARKKQTTENPPLLPNRPADFAKIENRARQAANGYGADVTINGYVYAKDVMVLLRYVEQLEGCLNKSINSEDTTEGFWEKSKKSNVP